MIQNGGVGAGGGSGDVTGPASSTDNAAVRYDGTTGKLLQNSAVIIDDSDNLGVNNTSPSTYLGVAGWVNEGVVVGDGGGSAGLVIYSTNTSTTSSIRFTDGTVDYDQGFIIYSHNADSMVLGTGRTTRMSIDSSGVSAFENYVKIKETSSVSTGSSGYGIFWAGTDSRPYYTDDSNNIFSLAGGAQLQTMPVSGCNGIDIGQNSIHYGSFYISSRVKINRIKYALTGASGSGAFELGIYNWAASGSFAKIVSASDSPTVAGEQTVTISDTVLSPGLYIGALLRTTASASDTALVRENASNTSAICFTVAGSSLPATESGSRVVSNRCPWFGLTYV